MAEKIPAGAAFKRLAQHDEGARAFLARLQAAGPKLHDLAEKYRPQIEAERQAWQDKYSGEPYPTGIDDWQRWAARVGVDPNRILDGDFDLCDLQTIVEGHLLMLRDGGPGGGRPAYRGDGVVNARGKSFILTDDETDLLERLLDGPKTLDELRRVTANPNRTLQRVRDKHPELADHIVLPGGRGRGGYRTTVEDGRTPETA